MQRKSILSLVVVLVLIFSVACLCNATGLSGILPQQSQQNRQPLPSQSNQPSATSQPSSTATAPSGSKYFTEDFSNGAPNWSYFVVDASIQLTSPGSLPSLASGNVGNMTVGPSNGAYVFDLEDKGQWAYAIYDAQDYDNVSLDVSADNRGNKR